MALTNAALADLQFSLRFAARRYKAFAEIVSSAESTALYVSMAGERHDDAAKLGRVADQGGLAQGNPTITDENAGSLLGMGEKDPESEAAAAYRVQRSENILGRIAAQLLSLSKSSHLTDVLKLVCQHIDERRQAVRAARQAAQPSTFTGGNYIAKEVGTKLADGREVDVWFGTNRRHSGRFLGERADYVTYGRCRVFVPSDRSSGSLGRGIVGRIIKGDNRVKLRKTDILDERLFWVLLANEAKSLESRADEGLVFLHGYNTKFEDAALRTAQLKVDLAIGGPTGFFSWPSLGYIVGYTGDEAAIEGSELEIRRFLVDFANRSGARTVNIIAHSMGNRGLLRAMDAIASAAALATTVRFGQVFLAAPDVDLQLFRNLSGAYGRLSQRATLYVTNNDKAIGLSRKLHKFARVGLTPPVAVVPGVDTVEASRVNFGFIGHNYGVGAQPILTDIYNLIQKDTSPDLRSGLRKVHNYWEFA